jgi:hypothetical protein
MKEGGVRSAAAAALLTPPLPAFPPGFLTEITRRSCSKIGGFSTYLRMVDPRPHAHRPRGECHRRASEGRFPEACFEGVDVSTEAVWHLAGARVGATHRSRLSSILKTVGWIGRR